MDPTHVQSAPERAMRKDRPPDRASLPALVVERDSHARELEATFLRALGLAVELAADGAAAWERAQELLPDLVVTEILVPRLDGLALCRRIKTSQATRH